MPLVTNTEMLTYLQSQEGVTVSAEVQALISLIQPMIEGEVKRIVGSQLETATFTEYYPESESTSQLDGEQLVVGYELSQPGGILIPRQRGDRSLATVRLRNLPVRSITSVYENPSAWGVAGGSWPEGTLLPANSYNLDTVDGNYCLTGKVFRVFGLWSTVPRCIKITYVAGYSTTELAALMPGVRLAVLIGTAYHVAAGVARSKMAQMGGQVSSVAIEGFSVGFAGNTVGQFNGQGQGYALPPEASAMLAPWVNLSRYFGT